MKQNMMLAVFVLSSLLFMPPGFCESMDELIDSFGKDFESLKPAPNSSVNADYKLEQAALGTFYTTKALNLIFNQNQEMIEKYDQMLMKYDDIVEQNKEIIRLLSIISKKETEKQTEDKVPLQ